MPNGSIIEYDVIRRAELHRTPYDYMMGTGAIRDEWKTPANLGKSEGRAVVFLSAP